MSRHVSTERAAFKPSRREWNPCLGIHINICFCVIQDKVNAFWEITKKDLEDRKAELRNKDREIEEMEERQQVEIKVKILSESMFSDAAES